MLITAWRSRPQKATHFSFLFPAATLHTPEVNFIAFKFFWTPAWLDVLWSYFHSDQTWRAGDTHTELAEQCSKAFSRHKEVQRLIWNNAQLFQKGNNSPFKDAQYSCGCTLKADWYATFSLWWTQGETSCCDNFKTCTEQNCFCSPSPFLSLALDFCHSWVAAFWHLFCLFIFHEKEPSLHTHFLLPSIALKKFRGSRMSWSSNVVTYFHCLFI